MAMWLHQLNQTSWPPQKFRFDIWENRRIHWEHGKIQSIQSDTLPERGDTVCFFYAEKGGKEPGIYGWAVIEWCDEVDVCFTPTTPTNHLKIDPWWDGKGGTVSKLVDAIRGNQPRATMFEVPAQVVPGIKQGIKKWLNS